MAKFMIQDIMPPEKRKRLEHDENTDSAPVKNRPTQKSPVEQNQQNQANQQHQYREPNPNGTTTNNHTHQKQQKAEQSSSRSHTLYIQKHKEPIYHEEVDAAYEQPAKNSYDPLYDDAKAISQKSREYEQILRKENIRFVPEIQARSNARSTAIIIKSFFVVAALIVIAIVAATLFGGAVVTLNPKHDIIALDEKSFRAEKNATAGNLPFSVMQLDLSESTEIPASGQKTVTAKASGKIVIYNNYNSKPQRLIKNTRFQSAAGRIYRINESLSVPGMTTVGGKQVPGTIEATIFADEPGPEYNSDPVDLTIPGLKGDPRFDKMYARAKTPISGGASGVMKSVADEDIAKAQDDLRVALETKLRTKARANVTENQVAFPNAFIVEFQKPELAADQGQSIDKAVIEQKGSIAVIIFNRAQLAKSIAKSSIPGYSNEDISIPNIDQLGFIFEKSAITDLMNSDMLDFKIKGNADVRYNINTDEVRKELAGVNKNTFNSIMAAIPTVDKAKASVRPFWESTFPTEKDKIKVIVEEKTPN